MQKENNNVSIFFWTNIISVIIEAFYRRLMVNLIQYYDIQNWKRRLFYSSMDDLQLISAFIKIPFRANRKESFSYLQENPAEIGLFVTTLKRGRSKSQT